LRVAGKNQKVAGYGLRVAGLILVVLVSFNSCKNSTGSSEKRTKETIAQVNVPSFSSDSAFGFIEKQLEFGPRVPNTEAHVGCAKWMEDKFRSYGADVLFRMPGLRLLMGQN
jgi:hypothetical protein